MEASAAQSEPQETPEQRDARLQQEAEKAAQARVDEQHKAEEEAGQKSGSPAVTDRETGVEGPHQQAATRESSREGAEQGVTQGLVGSQGAFGGGTPQAASGGSDPNTPIAVSAPPPASEANTNVRVDEGVVAQPSTLERSPQEFGAGGS